MKVEQILDRSPQPDGQQTLFYYPHYGAPSPYQKQIYAGLERTVARPGTVEVALKEQRNRTRNEAPVVLHLHWLGAVLARAQTRAEAEGLYDGFHDNLICFVRLGGIVLWTVHSGGLAYLGQFPDLEQQLRQDVAHLALRVHVHSRRLLPFLVDVLDIGPEKILVQPLRDEKICAALEQVIAEGYRFSTVQIPAEAQPQGGMLTGCSFPPATPARTAVIVLNYESTADSQRLIHALRVSSDQDFDLYVVDNASSDLSDYEAAVCFPTARVLRASHNLGYAAGNNLGLRLIEPLGYQFLWILNPDMVVPPEALQQHVVAAANYPEVSIFGPAICRGVDPDRVASAGSYVSFKDGLSTGNLYAANLVEKLPETPYEVDCLTGASLFLRAEVIKTIGYIPEDYFLYFEETQWLLEAGRNGQRCLVLPHIRPVHHQASHGSGLPRLYYFYYYLRNALLFCSRMGVDDLAPTLAALRSGFIATWLQRVEDADPDQLEFYQRLAERALADGQKGLSGQIDLAALEQTLRQPA